MTTMAMRLKILPRLPTCCRDESEGTLNFPPGKLGLRLALADKMWAKIFPVLFMHQRKKAILLSSLAAGELTCGKWTGEISAELKGANCQPPKESCVHHVEMQAIEREKMSDMAEAVADKVEWLVSEAEEPKTALLLQVDVRQKAEKRLVKMLLTRKPTRLNALVSVLAKLQL